MAARGVHSPTPRPFFSATFPPCSEITLPSPDARRLAQRCRPGPDPRRLARPPFIQRVPMSRPNESPGARLRGLWTRLSGLPGGRWIFSRLLGLMVPYTGGLGATGILFAPGHVRVRLKDRRKVRNHLHSIHAMALGNLGELSTGLAVLGAMPPSVRGILTGFEISYQKKARGVLIAEARCEVPEVTDSVDYSVDAEIRDAEGDVVATVRALWRLGPTKPQP